MGLNFLQDISNLDNIQFINSSGTNAGLINMDGNDLVISNSQGDVLLGDGSADVFIGDGTNNVDIRFEQSGSITADNSNATLTIGGTGNLVVEEPTINNPTFSGAFNLGSKLTLSTSNGYILFDYEPAGDTGEYTTEVPLLKVDHNGTEKTILSRISENGGIQLGHDDSILITAGDVGNEIKANWGATNENVVLASEAGFYALAFPNNSTTWSNRNIFRFYGGDGTAANNGLYIGDGGSTQFIDLDRNLKNIGTISSGAITSTGKIQGTELEGTSLDMNGNSDISGSLTVGGTSYFNSRANFNGTNDNSTYFAQGNYVEFSNDYLSRNQGNEFLYADRWATTNITGTFSYGSTSVFRPGDNFAAFVSSTGTDNPVSWEVLTSVTATTNVSARRVAIFAHSGFNCDLRIQVKKADSTYADIYNDSYTFNNSRWHLFALTGISYPGDWNILGVKVTIDDYGTSTRYIGQIGITNTRNHNTTPYIFRGGGNLYDNSTLSFGNGDDLQIYHDGSNSYISDNGTGVLYIRSGGNTSTTFNGTNVTFAGNVAVNGTVDGVDIGANYANWNTAYGWGDHASAGYLTGVSGNISVGSVNMTGELNFTGAGSKYIDVETLAGSNNLDIRHHNPTGNLFETAFRSTANGGTFLYYNGNTKFATTNTGISITGDISVSGTVDGRDVAADGTKLDTIDTNADVTPSWVPSSDPSYLTSLPSHNHDDRYYTETESDARYAALSHNHAASAIVTGTLADGRISESSVTQHEAALTITEGQLPDDMPSDKVKQICTTHHNFFMNSSSTSADFFVPFNNLNESSNPTNAQYYNRMVAPYNGRIVKVVLHTTAAIGTSCQVLFWVATSAGVFAPSAAETVTGVNLNTANTSATATFSTNSTAQFSAEDVLGVSIIKSSSATANMQVTVVWEYTL